MSELVDLGFCFSVRRQLTTYGDLKPPPQCVIRPLSFDYDACILKIFKENGFDRFPYKNKKTPVNSEDYSFLSDLSRVCRPRGPHPLRRSLR